MEVLSDACVSEGNDERMVIKRAMKNKNLMGGEVLKFLFLKKNKK